ncbi:unnamed protein product [Parajaminaea phylloscopi]
MSSSQGTAAETPTDGGKYMRVLFVRHGETDYNVRGIIQGQMDTPLNAQGRRQALATGVALRNEQIDVVYSSPLERTADTALAIVHQNSSSSTSLPVHFDPRLKERSFGSLEGNVTRAMKNAKGGMDNARDVESVAALSDRVANFWNDLLQRPDGGFVESRGGSTQIVAPRAAENQASGGSGSQSSAPNGKAHFPKTVLVVGHGAALGALLDVVQGYAFSVPGLEITRLWNCSITEVHVPLSSLTSPDMPEATALQRFRPTQELPERVALREAYRAAERHCAAEYDSKIAGGGDGDDDRRAAFIADAKLSLFPDVVEARAQVEKAREERAMASGITFVRWADIAHLTTSSLPDSHGHAGQGNGQTPGAIGVTTAANADEVRA